MSSTAPGVLFDVDGTLLDTNYHHVLAWEAAFREAGHDGVDMADVHRLIGRSSAELVAEILGHEDDAVVTGHSERYDQVRGFLEVRVVRGAAELVGECADRGLRVVLATSGSARDLEWMLPTIGAGDRLHGVTTADKVEASKPAPDLLAVAADENGLDLSRSVMVADTVWDVESARRLGIGSIALTSGGIGRLDLRDAGADEVWTNTEELLANLDRSLLGSLAS